MVFFSVLQMKDTAYKLLESGNGTKIADEKWHSVKVKYISQGKIAKPGLN